MNHGRKTQSLQLRVTPTIKRASERILWRLGLRMSDAVELFLRQVVVEEKIPFIVRAPSEPLLSRIGEVYTERPQRKPAVRARQATTGEKGFRPGPAKVG